MKPSAELHCTPSTTNGIAAKLERTFAGHLPLLLMFRRWCSFCRLGRRRKGMDITCYIADSTGLWRKRVGVEPTIRPAKGRIAGFEGRESHRTLFASVCSKLRHI